MPSQGDTTVTEVGLFEFGRGTLGSGAEIENDVVA